MNRHRSTPIKASITQVPNYPKKLTLFQIEASPYWYVRYYKDGKVLKRSTKTSDKREAIAFAKDFWQEIHSNAISSTPVDKLSNPTFRQVADAIISSLDAEVARGQITKDTAKNFKWKLRKSLIPFFDSTKISAVNYQAVESYLNTLSQAVPKLKSTTITGYKRTLTKVLNYAYKHEWIPFVPTLPKVSSDTGRRGRFDRSEYRLLHSRAYALARRNAVFQLRKVDGKATTWAELGTTEEGRAIKRTAITYELSQLIVFMVNSYIRPSDIKNIQHKHVKVETNSRLGKQHLILALPESKKKDTPIWTLPKAYLVYERLTAHNKKQGWGVGKDDYLFFPEAASRDRALKLLQMQFQALLQNLGFEEDANGNERSIYSLRHTAISFTLQYKPNVPIDALADNARTSVAVIKDFYARELGMVGRRFDSFLEGSR